MNIEQSINLLEWANLNKLYIETYNECDYHNIYKAIETLLTAYENLKSYNRGTKEALKVAEDLERQANKEAGDWETRYFELKQEFEKEKETSHYIQSQLDIANAKLVEEKEKNKELKEGYKIQEHNYQVAIKEIEQRCEDKIKAKIEEVDYKMIAHQDVREAVKQVLNSLLEKE